MPPCYLALGPQNLSMVWPCTTWLAEFNTSFSTPCSQIIYSQKALKRNVDFTEYFIDWGEVNLGHCSANNENIFPQSLCSRKSLIHSTAAVFSSKSSLVFLWQSFLNSSSFLFSPPSWEKFRFCSIRLHSRCGSLFFLRHDLRGLYFKSSGPFKQMRCSFQDDGQM